MIVWAYIPNKPGARIHRLASDGITLCNVERHEHNWAQDDELIYVDERPAGYRECKNCVALVRSARSQESIA